MRLSPSPTIRTTTSGSVSKATGFIFNRHGSGRIHEPDMSIRTGNAEQRNRNAQHARSRMIAREAKRVDCE
jgi:hypothetical protein